MDAQLRRDRSGLGQRPLPGGHREVTLGGPRDAELHQQVHALICRAW